MIKGKEIQIRCYSEIQQKWKTPLDRKSNWHMSIFWSHDIPSGNLFKGHKALWMWYPAYYISLLLHLYPKIRYQLQHKSSCYISSPHWINCHRQLPPANYPFTIFQALTLVKVLFYRGTFTSMIQKSTAKQNYKASHI